MKEFNIEKFLKKNGVWEIAQQIGAMELCQEPNFKEVISKQYDEFREFKEGAYKTYTALNKETIDRFVDTITVEAFTGLVIYEAIKTRSRDNKLDIEAATEAAYSKFVTMFVLKLQDMNLDAQETFIVF